MSDVKPTKSSGLSFDNQRLDKKALIANFQQKGRVHIPDFLSTESAAKIHEVLTRQVEWNLAWNKNGVHQDLSYTAVLGWTKAQRDALQDAIHTQAENGFQYHYAAIPIYDIVLNKTMPGHFFNELYEFFNSDELIDFAREISGNAAIRFADMQATRYSAEHFLTEHDDDVHGKNRLAAYVLNLTPNWRNDWGGALVFSEAENAVGEVFFPKFNALNIFTVPQKHAVSLVAPFVRAKRYSITGWFRY